MSEPSHRFLLPVEGLTVPSTWQVGLVSLHPRADIGRRLDEVIAGDSGPAHELFEQRVAEVLTHDTLAELDAPDIESAIATADAALNVLRVFQRFRHNQVADVGDFGLPGRLHRGIVHYIQLSERSGLRRLVACGKEFDRRFRNALAQSSVVATGHNPNYGAVFMLLGRTCWIEANRAEVGFNEAEIDIGLPNSDRESFGAPEYARPIG